MLTLIKEGGVLCMTFILLTGLIGLGAAFYFALRAQRQTYGFVKMMALTTLFGTLSATCADEGATLRAAAEVLDKGMLDKSVDAVHNIHIGLAIMVEGTAESMGPGLLGFSLLALTALFAAVGKRRLDARTAAV